MKVDSERRGRSGRPNSEFLSQNSPQGHVAYLTYTESGLPVSQGLRSCGYVTIHDSELAVDSAVQLDVDVTTHHFRCRATPGDGLHRVV